MPFLAKISGSKKVAQIYIKQDLNPDLEYFFGGSDPNLAIKLSGTTTLVTGNQNYSLFAIVCKSVDKSL
jgi:hypothetical protein